MFYLRHAYTHTRLAVLFLFGVLSVAPLSAQVELPSVSVAALTNGKYADIPVSHFTGTSNVSVPLMTVTDGPLALPVSLNYHTGGIRVGTPASPVGLGWNLSAGGLISRTVRDKLDEDRFKGYYVHGTNLSAPSYRYDDEDWEMDSEPDMFTYSFAGHHGKFYIDANREVHMVPKSELRVVVDHYPDDFIKFIITGTDGTRFHFGAYTNEDDDLIRAYDVHEVKDKDDQRVGWHLLAVVSADGNHVIELDYVADDYEVRMPKVCAADIKYRKTEGGAVSSIPLCDGQAGLGSTYYQKINSVLLAGIRTSTREDRVFETSLSDREDLQNNIRVNTRKVNTQTIRDTVVVKARKIDGFTTRIGNYCINWQLNQKYFTDDQISRGDQRLFRHKLKLASIQKSSCDGTVTEPPYEFTYHGREATDGNQFAPGVINTNIDHWGYYNFDGQNANPTGKYGSLTPHDTPAYINGKTTRYGDGNRETHPEAVKAGALTQVKYPTGGTMRLTYEANRYQVSKGQQTGWELSAYESGFINPDNDHSEEKHFTFTADLAEQNNLGWTLCVRGEGSAEDNDTRFDTDEDPFGNETIDQEESSAWGEGKVEIFTTSGTLVSTQSYSASAKEERCISGSFPYIGYSRNGRTALTVGTQYLIRVTATDARVRFEVKYDNKPDEALCGGLRVKRTTVRDGVDEANTIVKDYHYTSPAYPDVTSGVLLHKPRYVHKLNDKTAMFTSNSIAPLTDFNGYHVAYLRVEVDHKGTGSEEYLFNMEQDGTRDIGGYPISPVQFARADGSPRRSIVKDDDGQALVETTTTEYTRDYYRQGAGITFTKVNVPLYRSGSSPVNVWLHKTYRNRTGIYRPATVTITRQGVASQTEYAYAPGLEEPLSPTESRTSDHLGNEYVTETSYCYNYSSYSLKEKLKEHNMDSAPYRTERKVNGHLVGGSEVTFRFYNASGRSPSFSYSNRVDVPRIYANYKYDATWNDAGTLVGGWVEQNRITRYTSDGQIQQYNKPSWPATSIGYTNKRPSSKTNNGFTSSIVYEDQGPMVAASVAVDGSRTSYTYDALGRLKTTTDECTGITTTHDYQYQIGGTNRNYVEKATVFPNLDGRSAVTDLTTRAYSDGLGRNLFTVGFNQGPNANEHLITGGVDYDEYGRVRRQFEPIARSTFDENSFVFTKTSHDHNTVGYEDNPLGRKYATRPASWHASQYYYKTNEAADAVRIVGTNDYYEPETLFKSVVKDPNGNQLVTFQDILGRQILSRRTDDNDDVHKRLDTYYEYDLKGRTTKVIPPGADANNDDLVYSYVYDREDRVIEKSIPGAGTTTYRYNHKDLLVGYQDANLAKQSKIQGQGQGVWYAYVYDDHGRTIKEGFMDNAPSTSSSGIVLDEVLMENGYGTNPWDKDKLVTARTRVLGTDEFLTTENVYSTCGILDLQKSTNHLSVLSNAPNNPPDQTVLTYAGDRSIVQTAHTHYHNGQTVTSTSETNYDAAGRARENFLTYNGGPRTRLNSLRYDQRGNVTTKYQGDTYGAGRYDYYQKLDYSYLPNGMLQGINLGGGLSSSGVDVINWPSESDNRAALVPHISSYNDGAAGLDNRDLFHLELYRDVRPSTNTSSSAPARGNGDIVGVASQVLGRRQTLWDAHYDDYDRLVKANFYERTQNGGTARRLGNYEARFSYDERGNINTLSRWGTYLEGGRWRIGHVDNLDYDYHGDAGETAEHSTNQLQRVSDGTGSRHGYTAASTQGQYTYDDNGNLTHDPAKGITMTYNHLDKPTSIVWSGSSGNRMELTYDAGGTLLSRSLYNGGYLAARYDYVGGLEYVTKPFEQVNERLTSASHAEGRILIEDGAARYHYAIGDHLGNTRLVYTDMNGDGSLQLPDDIVEEHHYYPFGMKMGGPWMNNTATTDGASEFGYNGIEFVDDFELGVNMAHYRVLDPALGRWWSVDPKGEATKSLTLYGAMHNSPVRYADPKGDFIPAAILGAGIGLVTNGISNLSRGENFFKGGFKAAAFGAIGGALSFGIGNAASGMLADGASKLGVAAFQAGAHGFTGGALSVAQGGNFASGALSGAISSGLSSAGAALEISDAAMIGVGALGGGVGSVLGGGSFVAGVGQGLITSGLNHAAHSGFFGLDYAASLVTGKARHMFGADARSWGVDLDMSTPVAGINTSGGKVKLLRGPQKGQSFFVGEAAGALGFDISLSATYTRYYYSGRQGNLTSGLFNGPYTRFNFALSFGIDIGVSATISPQVGQETFILGLGGSIGVGIPTPFTLGASGSFEFGGAKVF